MSKRDTREESDSEDNKRRRLDEKIQLAPPICHDHDDTDTDTDTDDDSVEDDYAVTKIKDEDPDYVAAMMKDLEERHLFNLRSTESRCHVAFCSRCHHDWEAEDYVRYRYDPPFKQNNDKDHDPHSSFTSDLVDELPVKEDDDQEEHDAFERRIEARRSPKMCSGQKEVDIDGEEEEENRDSGIVMEKDDRMPRELVERVWALPDILVTVHKPGKDSSIGVVQEVLPDGSFKIALGSSGNGEVITAVRSEIEIVAPSVSDKVKIMATSHCGATGKVIDIEEGDAIVRLDGDTTNLILKMSIVAKLA